MIDQSLNPLFDREPAYACAERGPDPSRVRVRVSESLFCFVLLDFTTNEERNIV